MGKKKITSMNLFTLSGESAIENLTNYRLYYLCLLLMMYSLAANAQVTTAGTCSGTESIYVGGCTLSNQTNGRPYGYPFVGALGYKANKNERGKLKDFCFSETGSDAWGMYVGQCVSWCMYRLNKNPVRNADGTWTGITLGNFCLPGYGKGSALYWDDALHAFLNGTHTPSALEGRRVSIIDATVNNTPQPGDIAHWDAYEMSCYKYKADGTVKVQAKARCQDINNDGDFGGEGECISLDSFTCKTAFTESYRTYGSGHVAYVESVNPDGTVNISQYNADGKTSFSMSYGVVAPRYLRIEHDKKIDGYVPCISSTTHTLSHQINYSVSEGHTNSIPQIKVNWNASPNVPSSAWTIIRYRRCGEEKIELSNQLVTEVQPGVYEWTDHSIATNTTYGYVVKAGEPYNITLYQYRNAAGLCATDGYPEMYKAFVLPKPISFTATYTHADKSMHLLWGANIRKILIDFKPNSVWFEIQRKGTEETDAMYKTLDKILPNDPLPEIVNDYYLFDKLTFIDNTIEEGKKYQYRVRAIYNNYYATDYSHWTVPITAIALANPTIPMMALALNATHTDLVISWKVGKGMLPAISYYKLFLLGNEYQIPVLPSDDKGDIKIFTYPASLIPCGKTDILLKAVNIVGSQDSSEIFHNGVCTPQNVSAVMVGQLETYNANITWSDVNNDNGYEIYRNNVLIGTVSKNSTSFNDYNAKAYCGQALKYSVRAYRKTISYAFYSAMSAPSTMVIPKCKPSKPENFKAKLSTTTGQTKVYMTWNAAQYADYYVIYEVRNGSNIELETVPVPPYPASILSFSYPKSGAYTTCGKSEFKVAAFNIAGKKQSDIDPVHNGVCAPKNVHLAITNNTPVISWDGSAVNNETGFNIYRFVDQNSNGAPDLDSEQQYVGSVPADQQQFVIYNFPCGVPLRYIVRSVRNGLTSGSRLAIETIKTACSPQIFTVNLKADRTKAILNWADNSADYYELHYSYNSGPFNVLYLPASFKSYEFPQYGSIERGNYSFVLYSKTNTGGVAGTANGICILTHPTNITSSFTGSYSRVISWSHVQGAGSYEVQRQTWDLKWIPVLGSPTYYTSISVSLNSGQNNFRIRASGSCYPSDWSYTTIYSSYGGNTITIDITEENSGSLGARSSNIATNKEDSLQCNEHYLAIFPNPSSREINVPLDRFDEGWVEVEIIQSTSSNKVMHEKYNIGSEDKHMFNLDISSLPTGEYILQVGQGNHKQIGRFIKE